MTSPFVDTLVVQRTLRAPREKVFRAWSDPELLGQWLGNNGGDKTLAVEVDFRVGGRFHLQVRTPIGDIADLVGNYQEIVEPQRLVFTWAWSLHASVEDTTLVTVDLVEENGATHLTLTHERFRDVATRTFHVAGWDLCFARLEPLL